jgi:cobalt-zinc-cadmium efflux system membrane fusion protein
MNVQYTARGAGMVLVAVLGLAASSCKRTEPVRETPVEAGPAHAGPPVVHVDAALVSSGRIVVAPATRRPLRGDLRIPGEVVPSESGAADVGALVAGRIASIEVREGDPVKRGQALAYLDSPEAARFAADVIRARSRVIAAARKVERQVALEQDRATSAAAVDEARIELATAEADSAAAKTMLASLGMPEPPPPAQGALPARVPIRSPLDGVVVERMIALGAPVAPEKTLFRVLANDRVVVEARWTDTTTPPPAKDTPVKLLPRGGDGKVSCDGKVASTVGVVDERTRARRIRVIPNGPCAMLVAGAYVDTSFTSAALAGGAAAVLAVPKDTVVDVRGAPTVFVARQPSGAFEAHVVRTGRATTEDIAIEEGLAEGDPVVVAGAVLLKGELLRAELESQ